MDSDHGPQPYQGCALTKLSYAPVAPFQLKRLIYYNAALQTDKGNGEKIFNFSVPPVYVTRRRSSDESLSNYFHASR